MFSKFSFAKSTILFLLFGLIPVFIYGQVDRNFTFDWNEQNKTFHLNGENSPTLTLFEYGYYLFESRGGEFSITEQNNSIYDEPGIFYNSINGVGEYILFRPNENTPRILKYQNLDFPSNYGNLVIKSFEQVGFLKNESSMSGTKLGSSLSVTDELSIFAGAPGFNNNEGLICKFIQNIDGNYSTDKNITSPVMGSLFWGASMFYDKNFSSLLIGLPNANNYQGALYNYSTIEDSLRKITDGSGIGKMHGWSYSSTSGKTFIGELSALDADGGSVSIFRPSSSTYEFIQTLKSSVGQFGNEYGYSLDSFEDYLLVGAPGEDDLIREDLGAVYFYKFLEASFSSMKILPSNRNDGTRFGEVVRMTEDFIFIGAPNGDGRYPNSGVVHVYTYDNENFIVDEVFQILPPVDGSSLKFGQNIIVQDEFAFISAPGSGLKGEVYIFKKSDQSYLWQHVSSIELADFSQSLSWADNISLAINSGILAIGVEGESSIATDAGAVLVLDNPAWKLQQLPEVHPFFENNEIIELNATEDQPNPVSIDFNASIPEIFSNEVLWDVNCSDDRISENNFEINSTSGNFIFHLPQDLSGISHFDITLANGTQEHIHSFLVNILDVQDTPVFLDFDLIPEPIVLPKAAVSEAYNYFFNTFDADEDELSISLASGELPNGLMIDGLSIVGTPVSEQNASFDLTLSDGVLNHTKGFQINVVSSNDLPTVQYNGVEITNGQKITLSLKENFSITDWQTRLADLNISDSGQDELKISIEKHPLKGRIFTTPTFIDSNNSIKYFPNLNVFGDDSFTLTFEDNHPLNPKKFTLIFEVIIESENSLPIIVSDPPASIISVGSLYEHEFGIFDAEGDFFNLSFEGLPSWLSFDGIRSLRGVPRLSDLSDSDVFDKFVVSVTDNFNSDKAFSEIIYFKVVPEDNIWPPRIFEGDLVELSTLEDGDGLDVFLHSDDNSSMELSWEITSNPLFGTAQIIEQNSSHLHLSYLPDGNFSGKDSMNIRVFREDLTTHFYTTTINIDVLPVPDVPVFKSVPFVGIVSGKPYTLEVVGNDGDSDDRLILKKLKFPEWLHLDTQLSGNRSWVFKGTPNVSDNFEINLELSDGNSSAFQNYTLSVVDNVESLRFLTELPNEVNLSEDEKWDYNSSVSINSIEQIQVNWTLKVSPQYGDFQFDILENGTINNIIYTPQKHFYGSDSVILSVTDGYTSIDHMFNFYIEEVADSPFFIDFPEEFIESENEQFDLIIEYEEGDGINTSDLIFENLPEWLNTEILNVTDHTKKLRVFGIPSINDIGEHNIGVRVNGKYDGLSIYDSFKILVHYYNQPPVPWPSELFLEVNEDSSKTTWTELISAEDNETDKTELKWSIHENPENGYAELSLDGTILSYEPDKNFSGLDPFTLKVTDDGGRENSGFRHTLIPVSMEVLDVEDKPVFITKPPSDSNLSGVYTWNDERVFEYEIIVQDADWPWQGYPNITLQSNLPSWAIWKNMGEGKAMITGSPRWYDEGVYSFSILAESGSDKVSQNFDLEIKVDDYPPRIFKENGNEVNEKIKIFVLEDNYLGDVENVVAQLRAYNPDAELGDTLGWKILMRPTSGAILPQELSWNIDGDGYSSITNFSYILPKHFFGVDNFVLAAEEGDRATNLEFEIHVKSVQDPPEFIGDEITNIVKLVNPGDQFFLNLKAFDPDKQTIDFRLLFPSGSSKWLSISSTLDNDNIYEVKVEGIVPIANAGGVFTLVASDHTGRFSLLPFEILYE